MGKWLDILKTVGPLVLAFTPLAPLAPAITAGIAAAEQIPGATGPQKAAIVKQMVDMGVQATNAQAGRTILSPAEVSMASDAAIAAVVHTVNVIQAAQDALTPTPAPAPTTVP